MAITRIKNNQITDTTINAAAKLVDYSVTAGKLANSLVYGSDLTVSGNLTVNGQTTTIDTISTVIEDPILLLAKDQAAPSADIGYIGERGSATNIAFVWDESAGQFVTAFTTDTTTNTNITITSYADLKVNNFETVGNITIGGNISSLNVTGNITGGNVISTGIMSATGNVTGGNLTTGGTVAGATVSATGNVSGGNLTTAGAVDATGNVSGGNINTSGQVVASGNITASYFFGNGSQLTGIDATQIQSGTSNVKIDGVNGNVTMSVSGTSNVVVVNSAGGDVNGYWTATGNVTGGNLVTAGVVSATGNVSGGNLTTAGVVAATGNVSGGNLTTTGDVTGATATISGNVSGGNLTTAGVVSATGNVIGGNITTAGVVSATGNVSGGNLTTAGAVSAATVTATGNVSGGNLTTAGQVTATGNITGGNVITSLVTTSSGDLFLNSAGGALQWDGTGNIVMNSQWINNLSDPVAAYDAATKQYVDDAVSSGITIHTPVYLESPTALPAATYAQGGSTYTVTDTIAGNTVVFSTAANLQPNDQLWFSSSFSGIIANEAYFVVSTPNTSAAVLSMAYDGSPVSNITGASGLTQAVRVNSGVGATLTGNTNAALTVDGVAVTVNDRILVYQQATAYENGVYVVTQTGNVSAPYILTRSSDTNTYGPKSINQLDEGDYFYVQAGNTGAGESYVMTAPTGPFIIGYDNITFTQFSASQVYTANTAAGLVLNGTIFSAKIDNNTTAFDGSGNIIVKAGANLTTPNIGAATGTSLSVTGNLDGGNVTTGGQVTATGNVTGGNLITSGAVSSATVTATGNVSGGNITTAGVVAATGNVSGGNLTTTGAVTATGNVSGGNVTTAGIVSGGSASLTGNLDAAGATFTGNVTAANFIGNIAGNISGNVTAAGSNTQVQYNDNNLLGASSGFTFDSATGLLSVTGNISGGNLTTGGLVSATGNVTGGNITTGGLVSATGNVTGGNITTGGLVSATGNVTGGNLTTAGAVTSATVTATGNVAGGNITTAGVVAATGNVSGGNITTAGDVSGATGTFTGNVTAGNIDVAGQADLGNIVISGDNITGTNGIVTFNTAAADVDFRFSGDTVANLLVVDAGSDTVIIGSGTPTTGAALKVDTTNSILIPVGNTAQRPGTPVSGMVRYNNQTGLLEYYDADSWTSAGADFTVIASETFNGDGSTLVFTLGSSQTTASCIVSINGVVQLPGTAYSVSGTTLTFTEAPLSGDVIEVREITTTTTVLGLANGSGNATVDVSETASEVQVQGNLIPTANVTFNLGSNTAQWNDLYLSGNTIYLGGLQLQASGNTFVVYTADGVTQANIDAGAIDVSAISSGTSTIGISGANGPAYVTVGGTANVLVVTSTAANVTGAVNATGNITGGNLSGTNIVGTLTTAAQTNITSVGTLGSLAVTGNITSGNVSGTTGTFTNVAGTLTTAAQTNITSVGTLSSLTVTGNVSAGNLSGTNIVGTLTTAAQTNITSVGTLGSLTVTGNVTAGNLSVSTGAVTLGSIVNANANGVGNIGSATGYFNTVFAKATSAQYADLAEMYEADQMIEPGTVVCFGGAKEVTVCGDDASPRVAGVVSTNPSYIMNAGLAGDNVVAVALTGRVPTKVTGSVRKGDLMVAAGGGRARAEANPAVGQVIGKALADFDGVEGTIEVVVGRL